MKMICFLGFYTLRLYSQARIVYLCNITLLNVKKKIKLWDALKPIEKMYHAFCFFLVTL